MPPRKNRLDAGVAAARRRRLYTLGIALLLLSGCGTDATGVLTLSDVAGAYVVTTLEREIPDGTIDELARGAMLNLTLSADGSTTGRLFIPPDSDSTDAFDADLAGTWSLEGPLVKLVHPSNTFLVDIRLLFAAGRLGGERSTARETIRVILDR